jgi:hypothetical protein
MYSGGNSAPHRIFELSELLRKTMTRSLLVLFALLLANVSGYAQARGEGRGGPPPTPQAAAPFDMTGYWVSIVTEDWRWRMFPRILGTDSELLEVQTFGGCPSLSSKLATSTDHNQREGTYPLKEHEIISISRVQCGCE